MAHSRPSFFGSFMHAKALSTRRQPFFLAGQSPSAPLLYHLIGARDQRWRRIETQRPGRLQVDGDVEFGRCLNRKIGRLLAFKNAINIARRKFVLVLQIGLVGDQPARLHKGPVAVDRRQLETSSETHDQVAVTDRIAAVRHDQPTIGCAAKGPDQALDIASRAYFNWTYLHAEDRRDN